MLKELTLIQDRLYTGIKCLGYNCEVIQIIKLQSLITRCQVAYPATKENQQKKPTNQQKSVFRLIQMKYRAERKEFVTKLLPEKLLGTLFRMPEGKTCSGLVKNRSTHFNILSNLVILPF